MRNGSITIGEGRWVAAACEGCRREAVAKDGPEPQLFVSASRGGARTATNREWTSIHSQEDIDGAAAVVCRG